MSTNIIAFKLINYFKLHIKSYHTTSSVLSCKVDHYWCQKTRCLQHVTRFVTTCDRCDQIRQMMEIRSEVNRKDSLSTSYSMLLIISKHYLKNMILILKNGPSLASFCLFLSFSINLHNINCRLLWD